MDRRALLKLAGATAVTTVTSGAFTAFPAFATISPPIARALSFVNTHTGETFRGDYWERGAYLPDAMAQIQHVMRDHRNNAIHVVDPALLDQIADLHRVLGATQPYQIISGYRSPATNAALHEASSGVATRSLHMDGRAIDVRVAGVDLTRLRDTALAAQRGGVGYYEASNFVHLDTGRVRRW
jgi:uncharacterized protein YcbK (DUF882 family)